MQSRIAKNLVKLSSLVLLAGSTTSLLGAWTATQGAPAIDPLRFEEDMEAFAAEDRRSPPPEGAVVVTGSSSVRRWHPTIEADLAPLTIIPRGFGGSTMEDALYWIDRVAIAYRPRAVVIYEGDNDTGRYEVPPGTIAGQFQEIAAKIHGALPGTRIYVVSVKPSVSRWASWPQAVETNELLKGIAARNDLITYIDVATPMLKADGTVMADIFVEDDLHLNPKGYEIWATAIREILVPAESRYESSE